MENETPKQTMDFFKEISDGALIGLITFEFPQMKCTYMNPTALENLEMNPDSGPALELEQLVCENVKSPYRALSKELLQREGLIDDVMLKKMSGRNFIATLGLKRIVSGGSEYLLLMFQDVTFQKKLQRDVTLKQEELKKTYEEILEQNRALLELDKAKDKFIALITHELRTPLSAIVATTECLNMKLYDDETQLADFIATVFTESQHLMAIVNDILDFSKMQTGKMEFFIEQADPTTLIKKHIDGFQKMAQGNESTLQFFEPEAPLSCYYDELRLSQVVANVISNAVKFNRKGMSVTVSIEDKEDFVVVSIQDEGIGIPAQFVSKVFNEFETVGNIKTHQKGTGLGMPISKKLIEGMGGKIWFESEENVGTVFYIEIPKNKALSEESYRARPSMMDDLAA